MLSEVLSLSSNHPQSSCPSSVRTAEGPHMTQHGGYTEESQGDSSQSRDPAAVLVRLRLVGILNYEKEIVALVL